MEPQQIFQESVSLFRNALFEAVTKELMNEFGYDWEQKALNPPGSDSIMTHRKKPQSWDLIVLIQILHAHWEGLFEKKLGKKLPRAVFTLVKFYRNAWAHQQTLTLRETYRALDCMEAVISALGTQNPDLEKLRLSTLFQLAHSESQVPQLSVCQNCKVPKAPQETAICSQGCVVCYFCLNQQLKTSDFRCPVCHRQLLQEEVNHIAFTLQSLF